MATDMCALTTLLLTGTMIIGDFTGMGDFIDCNVVRFLHFPVIVINLTLLMIAVDKVIGITFLMRYRQIMKPRVVFGIITTKINGYWQLYMLFIHNLISPKGLEMAKYGTCRTNDGLLLETFVTYLFLMFLASL